MKFIIIENKYLVDFENFQTKHPRSKKKRIRKKFAKKYTLKIEVPSRHVLYDGKHIFCHPETAKLLRKSITTEAPNYQEKWKDVFRNSLYW